MTTSDKNENNFVYLFAAQTTQVSDDSQGAQERQGRKLEVDHDDDTDEEMSESQQWSVISLFSRVLPQRI